MFGLAFEFVPGVQRLRELYGVKLGMVLRLLSASTWSLCRIEQLGQGTCGCCRFS